MSQADAVGRGQGLWSEIKLLSSIGVKESEYIRRVGRHLQRGVVKITVELFSHWHALTEQNHALLERIAHPQQKEGR